MDRERLKLIHKNLKSLLNALEAEIYSDPNAYIKLDRHDVSAAYARYDDDDDGYAD